MYLTNLYQCVCMKQSGCEVQFMEGARNIMYPVGHLSCDYRVPLSCQPVTP